MRFSMKDGEVDKEQMRKMVGCFSGAGLQLFPDTAQGYLDGKVSLPFAIARTACRCTADARNRFPFPDLFACMNVKKVFNDCNANYYYSNVHTVHNGKASDCIKCGKWQKASHSYQRFAGRCGEGI